MANKEIVVGGVIATAAIIFAVFVSFNSITDNGTGELIVTNGNYSTNNNSLICHDEIVFD